jgi:uncharacterized protein (DUF433 family)
MKAKADSGKHWTSADKQQLKSLARENTPTRVIGRVQLGKYIIADRRICGGQPTFEGSRVMVWQVIEQVASGMPWEHICWAWRGKVSHEAIAEALQLAADGLRTSRHVRIRRERLRTRSLAAA